MKTHWYLPIGLALVSISLLMVLKPNTETNLPAQKDFPNQRSVEPIQSEPYEDSVPATTKLKKDLPHNQVVKYAKSTGKSNNSFAEKLAKLYIKTQKNKNIFFSPFSISSAVSMTGEGAKGETQQQILDVFSMSGTDSLRKYGVLGLYDLLNKPESGYKLNTSNSLWIQQGEKLKPEFLESSKDFYRANVESVDFSNPAEASKKINQFVEKKTENRIKNLISPNMINAKTRLILTNTIYFKADWRKKFDANDTYKDNFTTSNGESKLVDMMHQKSYFNYFENESFQALEMEYKNGEMSMIVVLPQSEDEGSIAEIDLDKAIGLSSNQLKSQEVRVSFPKFKFETSYMLKQDLSTLGMPVAFQDDADFSGISKTSLKIADVIHKAFVEVAEKGTEAAAATAVVMEITSSAPRIENPIKTFRADHPFIFMIRHNETGTILFMGVVNNPSKS